MPLDRLLRTMAWNFSNLQRWLTHKPDENAKDNFDYSLTNTYTVCPCFAYSVFTSYVTSVHIYADTCELWMQSSFAFRCLPTPRDSVVIDRFVTEYDRCDDYCQLPPRISITGSVRPSIRRFTGRLVSEHDRYDNYRLYRHRRRLPASP